MHTSVIRIASCFFWHIGQSHLLSPCSSSCPRSFPVTACSMDLLKCNVLGRCRELTSSDHMPRVGTGTVRQRKGSDRELVVPQTSHVTCKEACQTSRSAQQMKPTVVRRAPYSGATTASSNSFVDDSSSGHSCGLDFPTKGSSSSFTRETGCHNSGNNLTKHR